MEMGTETALPARAICSTQSSSVKPTASNMAVSFFLVFLLFLAAFKSCRMPETSEFSV